MIGRSRSAATAAAAPDPTGPLSHGAQVVAAEVGRGKELLIDAVGGPARMKVVALLAAVLALGSADTGAVSAVAPGLERSLHIGNVDLGLLVTVSGLAAAVGMLPAGWATDRRRRTTMLVVGLVTWGVAEILSAVSPSYGFLLAVRLGLGVMTAVTGPTVASLTGDLFPSAERARIYGYVLTGELIGAGLGLVVAGLVSSWATWRVALVVLSVPSFVLAVVLHRGLPEPARGGQSRLARGATEVVGAAQLDDASPGPDPGAAAGGGAPEDPEDDVHRQVRQHHLDPRRGVLLDQDPMGLGWWSSFRYVVSVHSNVTLIVASALGYFFFGGVETFAFVYLEGRYHIGQGVATVVVVAVGAAAVAGAVLGGRITDRWLRQGRLDARLVLPALAFVAAAAAFVPGVLTTSLAIAIPFLLVAGTFVTAPNPGLDAARLDVVPARLWGRAEAVRSLLRDLLQSFAPLVFGLVSTLFGGRDHGLATGAGTHSHGSAAGLTPTFLLMLVALLAAAVVVFRGRRAYPVDVAAAGENDRRFPPGADEPADR